MAPTRKLGANQNEEMAVHQTEEGGAAPHNLWVVEGTTSAVDRGWQRLEMAAEHRGGDLPECVVSLGVGNKH